MDGTSPHGFYSSECWTQLTQVKAPATQGALLMVKWKHLQPQEGVYTWDALDVNLTKAVALDQQVIIMVEICKADPADPAAPLWIYDEVPSVNFTHGPSPPNTTNPHRCPYYISPVFQRRYLALLTALAAHLAGLPHDVRNMIAAVQVPYGITGDDRPWNGVPINPSFVISDAEWVEYVRTMALQTCPIFADKGLSVLFNLENPGRNDSSDEY
eukprot:Hpha_TRINITY_DN5775_c0_g1::TRINITY_DN5775_c0_g1_i3::g.147594::m.147594